MSNSILIRAKRSAITVAMASPVLRPAALRARTAFLGMKKNSWPHVQAASQQDAATRRYVPALRRLVAYAERYPAQPGVAEEFRRVVVASKSDQVLELARELYDSHLDAVYSSPRDSSDVLNVDIAINILLYHTAIRRYRVVIDYFAEVSDHLAEHKLYPFILGQLVASLRDEPPSEDKFRCLYKLLEVAFRTGTDTTFYRRVLAFANRQIVTYAQSFGRDPDNPIPLLDEAVFEVFRERGTSLWSEVERLSPIAARWLRMSDQSDRIAWSPPTERPVRILVVSDNWNFLQGPVEAFRREGCDVRALPFEMIRQRIDAEAKKVKAAPNFYELMYASGPHRISREQGHSIVSSLAPAASDLIAWCDLVFAEWWGAPAVWFSRYLPPEKKLVVRCHSYEAFSHWPMFTDLGGVDGAVFVADHIKRIAEQALEVDASSKTRFGVAANVRPQQDDRLGMRAEERDRFTIGLLGYNTENKGPIFATKLLRKLREKDARWRLLLAGHPFPDQGRTQRETQYADDFRARCAELGDAVVIDGFQDDPPTWLAQLGFILSTSHREGTHEAVLDGMLQGCIPVLRKWPLVSPYGAPSTSFPDLPAFETPEEMAEHILEVQEKFDEYSAEMRLLGKAMVDPTRTGEELKKFLLIDRRVAEVS